VTTWWNYFWQMSDSWDLCWCKSRTETGHTI